MTPGMDVFDLLSALPSESGGGLRRPAWARRALVSLPLDLVVIPILVTALSWLVYGGVLHLVWPPPATTLLALPASFGLGVATGRPQWAAAAIAFASGVATLLLTWTVVFAVGTYVLLQCFRPGSGCLPW